MLSVARRCTLFHALCLCVCSFLSLAIAQEAQPTPTPEASDEVVRINTELVQTDIMVFDKQGKFVDGLNADQFDLRVDGKPQTVVFFERVKAGAMDEDAQLAAARGGATRRAGDKAGAAIPLDRGRAIFFFVDDIHLAPGNSTRIRQLLLRFVEEELGQNDEAAIISATGQPGFLQQLTGEKAVLRAAINRLKPKSYFTRDGQTPPMSEAQALAIERNDNSVLDYFVEAVQRDTPMLSRASIEQMVMQRARGILSQANFYADNTLSSLEGLVRGAAPLPGRKLVFFISDGFLLDFRGSSAKDRLQSVTDAAARSGVVIYSLGAQGLTSGMPDAATEAAFDPTGRLARTDASELSGTQELLYTLAADTGGRALVNTNALDAAVEKAVAETSVYYLLAWRPENVVANAPKFRRIEASVKGRPDLRLIVRRGFFDAPRPEQPVANPKKKAKPEASKTPTPPSVAMADKELFSALRSRHPRNSFPTSLSLGYVNIPNQGTLLTATIGIDRELFDQLSAGVKDGGRVDVAGAIYNDKGDALSAFKQELLVRPVPPRSKRHSILYSHTFRLAPGLYQVRVATLERASARSGSATQWVEIPAINQKQFSLSSLFIGERAMKEAASAAPVGVGAEADVMVSVDRRFERNSHIRFVTYIYNATGGAAASPDVALQVQLFRDDQPVFTAPLIKVKTAEVADLSRIPYAAELSLASFPPGSYVLQLTALDRIAKTSAAQRVKFFVE